MKIPKRTFLLIPLAALLFSCADQPEKGEEVAQVNGSPIYMKELVSEVNRTSKREPGVKLTEERVEEILHTMIDKKLLIDEAVKKGLSEDERFLQSIKSFWEQTLIRELIETKNREWADKLFVTDEEVKERYGLMQNKLTIRFVKTHNPKEAASLMERLPKEGILMGPLFMEDLKPSDPFFPAFGMAVGAKASVTHDDDFYAFEVVKKTPSGAPPLEGVYDALKANLLEEKKELVLEEWLEARKKAATITVNKDMIERLK